MLNTDLHINAICQSILARDSINYEIDHSLYDNEQYHDLSDHNPLQDDVQVITLLQLELSERGLK